MKPLEIQIRDLYVEYLNHPALKSLSWIKTEDEFKSKSTVQVFKSYNTGFPWFYRVFPLCTCITREGKMKLYVFNPLDKESKLISQDFRNRPV